MMVATRVVAAVGLASAVLTACGDIVARRPEGGPPVTPQAESMKRMVADVDTVRSFAKGGVSDPAQAEAAAADLLQWSDRMAELFPPGVAPSLYPDMTEQMVRRAPAAMRRTAEDLLSAAKTGDRTAVAGKLAAVERDGCGACHR